MDIVKEVVDNSTHSPRLTNLQKSLDSWIETYNPTNQDERIDLVVLGYDHKYKHAFKLALTSKTNPQNDICRAFNKGLGKLNDNLSRDIFNGACQYFANLFANYPELEKLFNDNVKRMKESK